MKSLLTVIAWLYLFVTALSAQTPLSEDIKAALDDGGLSTPNNIIQFDALAPLAGEISFGYERVIQKWLSLDISVGIGLPYYLIDLRNITGVFGLSDPSQDLARIEGGYSFSFAPRIYFQGFAPESYFFNPGYRFRRINRSQDYDLVLQDYFLSFGYSRYIGPRLLLSYSFGLGIHQISYRSHPNFMDLSILDKKILSLPTSLRVGYIF